MNSQVIREINPEGYGISTVINMYPLKMYTVTCLYNNLLVCFKFFSRETPQWLARPDVSRDAVVHLSVNKELMNACNIQKYFLFGLILIFFIWGKDA